jgi:hypothetical protein
MRTAKTFSTVIILGVMVAFSFATDLRVHIYTPRGNEIDDCWLLIEDISSTLNGRDVDFATNYPEATQIILPGNTYSSSRKFNSHGYAFHMIGDDSLSHRVWMGYTENHVSDYWNDYSYSEVDSQYALIAVFTLNAHSAVLTVRLQS